MLQIAELHISWISTLDICCFFRYFPDIYSDSFQIHFTDIFLQSVTCSYMFLMTYKIIRNFEFLLCPAYYWYYVINVPSSNSSTLPRSEGWSSIILALALLKSMIHFSYFLHKVWGYSYYCIVTISNMNIYLFQICVEKATFLHCLFFVILSKDQLATCAGVFNWPYLFHSGGFLPFWYHHHVLRILGLYSKLKK